MPTEIDRRRVRDLLAAGAQLVDVLPAAEYAAEHIAGAVGIPLKQLDRATTRRLDPARPLIVSCWDHQ